MTESPAETTEEMLARVRASFDRQGMMSTLGVQVTSVEPGKVEMSLRHDDRFTQQHGFLHAGAVASVMDTACGFAAFSVMPPDAAVLTAADRRRAVTIPERSGRRVRPVRQGVATRAAFWRAWSVWAVTMAITATAIGYDALHPLPAKLASNSGNSLDMVVGLTFIVAFATVGALLAWKKPGNPIGWLLSGSGLAYALGGFGLMLVHFPRTWTLGNWLGWTWLLGLGLCVFVALLFPAGSLPSRRWRPVAWATGAGLAGWVLGNAFAPRIISADPPVSNPVGVNGTPGRILTAMAGGSAALLAASGLAAVLSLVFRYRRAQAAERAQLRWLVYASALIVAAFLAETLAEKVVGPGATATNLQNAMGSGAAALIPVAIGIAVLRYRLYDIDRIISRTVAYAIVTGLLVGVYAGLVLLATQVLRFRTPVAVAAATLAAAALFTPVRRRVQSRVDRRFNRARYDADHIAAAFAARLKDTVDLGSVRDDLAGIVSRALEPTHVSVWISDGGARRLAGPWSSSSGP